jgi:ElaB/YqjD/DUF883 family membrane-anchored ribosome-binding protein
MKECKMDQINNTESLTPVRDTNEYEMKSQGGNSTFNNIKSVVADKLKAAAQTLEGKAEQNSPASGYAKQASGWLAGAADYVRDVNTDQVKSDIQRQVRSNPGRTLLIAGAVGLALGALLKRR